MVRPPPGGKAKLTIDASPWANVFVDGKKVGQTPVTNYTIAAGPHSIKVTNPDLNQTRTLKIDAKPNEVIRKKVTFKVGTGKLLVRAKPWADVYLNGKKIGTTPMAPKELAEGTYKVRLHNPTLDQVVNKKVVIKAGQTERINVNFLE